MTWTAQQGSLAHEGVWMIRIRNFGVTNERDQIPSSNLTLLESRAEAMSPGCYQEANPSIQTEWVFTSAKLKV